MICVLICFSSLQCTFLNPQFLNLQLNSLVLESLTNLHVNSWRKRFKTSQNMLPSRFYQEIFISCTAGTFPRVRAEPLSNVLQHMVTQDFEDF